MTIPLMYYLRHTATRKWLRHGLLLLMVLSVAAALGTQSRGALLALMAMGALLWWRGHNKAMTLIPILVLGVAAFALMPESWHERMSTIQEYEQDGSAMGRINTWGVMVEIANDRITGGGFAIYALDVFRRYSEHRVLAAHSIYFQVLGEHGWIGLFLFLLLWVTGWRKAGAIRRLARSPQVNDPGLATLAGMCQVSLVGFAVGGAFLSLAYFDLPYNILVMLIVAQRLARRAQEGVAKGTARASGRNAEIEGRPAFSAQSRRPAFTSRGGH
jgi:putative inorganic carbon (HCO3(-)) transporter